MPAANACARDRLIDALPFHYGWVILAGGALGAFMTTPGQTTGVSSFFDPVANDLSLSRAEVALAYTVGTLAGILPAPLLGRWLDRRGPRLAAAVVAVVVTIACGVMSLVQGALTLTLAFALLRGAAVGGLALVSQHVINLWFVHRRGMAAATASLGTALGAVVFPPFSEALIQTHGWRQGYATLGVLVGVAMVPVGLVFFRERPEQYGVQPDLGRAMMRSSPRLEPAFTRGEALRTPVFWTLSFANVMSNALGTGLLLNHYDLLARGGVPRDIAVFVFTPLAITQVIATLATGRAVDRFRPHRLIALPMAAMASACLLIGTASSPRAAFVYAVVLGLALGSFAAINAAAYAHYFGRAHAGEIRAVTFVITIIGAAAGPLPFGWSAEHGGYVPVLLVGATLCALAAAANLSVSGSATPRR